MDDLTHLITSSLLSSSDVTRLALTAPNERLRRRAAAELARAIAGALEPATVSCDGRQFALPL